MTDDAFDPKERPTQPDLVVHICPECFGKGKIPLEGGSHKPCSVCWGRREIDREQMAAWKLKNG